MNRTAGEVIDFWRNLGSKGWFSKSDAVDAEIAERFGAVVARAAGGDFDDWRTDPQSCLALILVLDQFSRNIHRGDARAFAGDARAVEVAREALAAGYDKRVDHDLASFFYMPFMHSECLADQQTCVALMHANSGAESLKFALLHRDIIARFGRFPHRNPALGRHTTPAEQAFLDQGGFSG